MAITRQNVIVDLDLETAKARRNARQIRDEINGIRDVSEEFRDTMTEALEERVVQDFLNRFQELGEEFDNIEEAAAGIREELRVSFDVSNPEAYRESLLNILNTLESTENQVQDVSKALDLTSRNLIRMRNLFDRLRTGAVNFGRVARVALRGISGLASTAFGTLKRIALGALVDIGLRLTAFGRGFRDFFDARGVADAFKPVNDFLNRLGRTLASVVEPIIRRIGAAFERLTESLDFTKLQRTFSIFVVFLQQIFSGITKSFGFGSGDGGDVVDKFNDLLLRIFANVEAFARFLQATFIGLRQDFLDFQRTIADSTLFGDDEALRNAERRLRQFRRDVIQPFLISIGELNESEIDPLANFPTGTERLERVTFQSLFEFARRRLEENVEAFQATLGDIDVSAPRKKVEEEAKALSGSLDFLDQEIQKLQATLNAATTDEERLKASIGVDELKKIRAELELELERLKAQLNGLLDGVVEELPTLNIIDQIISEDDLETLEKRSQNFLKRIANFYARLAKLDEDRREKLFKTLDDIQDVVTGFGQGTAAAFDGANEAISRQLELYDRLLEQQETRVEKSLLLAERGNAELLQIEQERLDKMIAAREDAQRRQEQIARAAIVAAQAQAVAEGILAVVRAFATPGGLVQGIATSIALAGTIAGAIISLNQAFSDIPSFRKGTPEYVPGPATEGKVIQVHGGERVLTPEQNAKLGGKALSNDRLVELAQLGLRLESFLIGPSIPTVSAQAIERDSSLDLAELKDEIQTTNVKLDRLTKAVSMQRTEFNITAEGIHGAVQQVERRNNRRNNLLG